MVRNIALVCMVIALFLTAGCTRSDSPEGVADKFWGALIDRDIDKARSYATENSAASLQENKNNADGEAEITFGEVKTENGKSTIETTMHSSTGEMELNIPMKTFLVQEDGEWKVDANQTMMSMFGGAMGELMEGFGDAMKDSMREMGKAMGEGMREGMKESMSEEQMEETIRQMEEGMEERQ